MIYNRSYVIMLGGRSPKTENKRICVLSGLKSGRGGWWSLTRGLLKQYLTEKQNGCLRGGRLREVVAYEKWSL